MKGDTINTDRTTTAASSLRANLEAAEHAAHVGAYEVMMAHWNRAVWERHEYEASLELDRAAAEARRRTR